MQATARPVPSSERIDILDVLRGFAIFGILMVNMPLMFRPISAVLSEASAEAPLHQELAESIIQLFFSGKFYILFSFLFGFGFWVFIHKGGEQQPELLTLYKRRLFFLFLFGIVHISLLWPGDILLFYSLFGFLLILFRDVSDRKASGWLLFFAMLPSLLTGLMVMCANALAGIPEAKQAMDTALAAEVAATAELVVRANEVYTTGTMLQVIAMNWEQWGSLLTGIVFFYPPVLGMFILGYMTARRGWLTHYRDHLPMFRKIFRSALAVALPANILLLKVYEYSDINVFDEWLFLEVLLTQVGGISLMLVYVSGVVLLFASGKASVFSNLLAPVGRMALTNYISHSFIAALLFMPWGFGLFGTPEVWQGMLLTLMIYALQIPLSRWWLSRFHFGPLEWLWRSLTYGKIQAFRKEKI